MRLSRQGARRAKGTPLRTYFTFPNAHERRTIMAKAKSVSAKTSESTEEKKERPRATRNDRPKYEAPAGYEKQSDDVVGFWDPAIGPIHFIPTGGRLFDGSIEPHKPSALIVGKLVDATDLVTRDDEVIAAQPGEQIGVWAKPGMSAVKNLAGVKVFMYEDGELDTGKPNPMKIYEVLSRGKGKPLPVSDSRKKSKSTTHFLTTDTTIEKSAPARESGEDEDESFDTGSFDS